MPVIAYLFQVETLGSVVASEKQGHKKPLPLRHREIRMDEIVPVQGEESPRQEDVAAPMSLANFAMRPAPFQGGLRAVEETPTCCQTAESISHVGVSPIFVWDFLAFWTVTLAVAEISVRS
eukprot:s3121_g1.t1